MKEKDPETAVLFVGTPTAVSYTHLDVYKRQICPGLETVLLPASAAYEHFSSTMVREMIRYHQPVEKYVPAPVAEELMRQRG